MIFYIAIAVLLSLLSVIYKDKSSQILLFLVVTILFVATAWRGINVGTDTANYYLQFQYLNSEFSFIDVRFNEFAFPLIMFVVQRLGFGFRTFLIVAGALFCIPAYFICRKSGYPLFALLLFWLLGVFFNFFNISRQEITVVLSLCGFFFLEKGKTIAWLLMVFFAMTFHTSAIITLLFWPLSKIKINQEKLWVVPMLFTITFALPFVIDTVRIIGILDSVSFVNDVYGVYTGDKFIQDKNLFSLNRLMLNLFFSTVPFIGNNRQFLRRSYFTFVIVYVVLYNLFPFSGVVGRIAIYFSIFQILFLADFARHGWLNWILVLLFSVSIFSMYLINNIADILPYTFSFRQII